MSDFAAYGRRELIFFPKGQVVRWHIDGMGPYDPVKVVRTARTRVLVERQGGKRAWVPNLQLSHYEDRQTLEREAAECGWTVYADQPVRRPE